MIEKITHSKRITEQTIIKIRAHVGIVFPPTFNYFVPQEN